MTKIAGRSGCEVNLVQTHSLQKDAATGQQKKLSTAESGSQAALTDKLEVANRSSLFSMQSQSAGGSLRDPSLAGIHSFEGRLLDSVRQRIARGLENVSGPGTPGQVSGPSVTERIADAKGRAVQGGGFSFRGILVWQGIRRDQDPIMSGGVRDSSGIGDHSVRFEYVRLGPPIDETHTFREHYDSNGNVLGWTQEEEYRHTNGNIVARIRWRPAGGDGWGPWETWISTPERDGTYGTMLLVQPPDRNAQIVPGLTKTWTDGGDRTTTAAGVKDGGKKGLVAGGYGPGDPRTGEQAVSTPADLPGDGLVLMLKNLGFGALSRDLVWNPDTEAGEGGDTVHSLGRTSYGPGGRPEGPAGSTGSPTKSLPINKDVFGTDPPLTEDTKRNPGGA